MGQITDTAHGLVSNCVCVCSAGEMLSVAEQFLEQQMHPTVIISAYRQALEDMLETLKEIRWVSYLVSLDLPQGFTDLTET